MASRTGAAQPILRTSFLPMPDRSPPSNDRGRILRFQPRRAPHDWPWSVRAPPHGVEPVDDLAKFEQDEDDYRHRMKMNALALLVTAVLVIAGVWLATKLAEMRTIQDCFLSGRRNCAPINASPVERG